MEVERFGSIGLLENEVYPGIPDLLAALKDCGHALYIVTSKPTFYAEPIARHFGLNAFFRRIYGSEMDGKLSEKTSLIAHILKQEDLVPGDTIMIGDREHDVIGARNNGTRAIAVLWGYGTREELGNSGAPAFAESPEDLFSAITELCRSAWRPQRY